MASLRTRRPRKRQRPVQSYRADWRHPTEIRFGVGRLDELPETCQRHAMFHPLLITDEGIAPLAFVQQAVLRNREAGIETGFHVLEQNEPGLTTVKRGVTEMSQGGFDGIIAIGGGSVLDAAKAIALGHAVGIASLWQFASAVDPGGFEEEGARIPRIIAVPTTAGTGSEVGTNAVITDEETQVKRSLFHPRLLPSAVIADPAVTRNLSQEVTATTGIDALSHNLEALCAPGFYPMHDAVALQGIYLISQWLVRAYQEPKDLHARVHVMAASIMGAIAFGKGLGAMHAIAHAVGARYKTHHGRTIAVTMPYVLKLNRRPINDKMVQLARYIGLSQHSFDGVLDWTLDLRHDLALPHTLAELGVQEQDIPLLAERAMNDGNAPTNPVALKRERVSKLLRNLIAGRL